MYMYGLMKKKLNKKIRKRITKYLDNSNINKGCLFITYFEYNFFHFRTMIFWCITKCAFGIIGYI
ncbi:hypothetical protein Mgra_00006930 [Meloidogyne graminicola]|uniref:Uncharacterized protein n=1 Tax=Meloidogyne graminicola TaxID=189291 RepID=A0A8S9ZK21_9BILA|nr:hypothetical protein Mgra_00006930 [Meloidogyne graminicola]